MLIFLTSTFFPSPFAEEKVYSHFKLAKEESPKKKAKNEEDGIESQLRQNRKLYQFGKTKIFFRPGQVALLERIRSQKLRECAVLMQRMIRGWLVRKRFLKIKESILRLQRYSRGFLARRRYLHLRQTKAATVIQTAWRRHHQRKVYLQVNCHWKVFYFQLLTLTFFVFFSRFATLSWRFRPPVGPTSPVSGTWPSDRHSPPLPFNGTGAATLPVSGTPTREPR